MKRSLSFLVFIFAAVELRAQPQPVVFESGYARPSVWAAPGQVITLFVSGVTAGPGLAPGQIVRAERTPLPSELSGLTVTLMQRGAQISVPLLRVEYIDDSVTAVTVQMPFELATNIYRGGVIRDDSDINTAFLVITKDRAPGPRIGIFSQSTNVHVVTECEVRDVGIRQNPRYPIYPCRPAITHADGSIVGGTDIEKPAGAGEVLTIYAFGLGRPDGELPASGVTANQPIRLNWDWPLYFEFQTSAVPARRIESQTGFPLYVGLVPGYVGLYQINFKLPNQLPSTLITCSEAGGFGNLTITVNGERSSDRAAICIR